MTTDQPTRTRRQHILDHIPDVIGEFLYYDRKEDDDLPVGAIEEAIKAGEITVDEIAVAFTESLRRGLGIKK